MCEQWKSLGPDPETDFIGVGGALEPAFDKFPSGYDAYLP